VHCDEIAQNAGAEPKLTCKMIITFLSRYINETGEVRIMRYLAAIGAVSEVSAGQYAANNITRNLTNKAVEAGLSH
jgi:UDP-glucose 4-epimerase